MVIQTVQIKLKELMKKIIFPSSRLVYGDQIFWMQQRMVPFSAGTNGEYNGSLSG